MKDLHISDWNRTLNRNGNSCLCQSYELPPWNTEWKEKRKSKSVLLYFHSCELYNKGWKPATPKNTPVKIHWFSSSKNTCSRWWVNIWGKQMCWFHLFWLVRLALLLILMVLLVLCCFIIFFNLRHIRLKCISRMQIVWTYFNSKNKMLYTFEAKPNHLPREDPKPWHLSPYLDAAPFQQPHWLRWRFCSKTEILGHRILCTFIWSKSICLSRVH